MKKLFKQIGSLFTKEGQRNDTSFEPLTSFAYKKYIALLVRQERKLRLLGSKNGTTFTFSRSDIEIVDRDGNTVALDTTRDFSIAHTGNEYVLTYVQERGTKTVLVTATSRDLLSWIVVSEEDVAPAHTVLVSGAENAGVVRAYAGKGSLYAGTFTDTWDYTTHPALAPREGYFDSTIQRALTATEAEHGTLVLFVTDDAQVGAVLLDKEHPSRWLWRSEKPLWTNTTGMPIVGAVITRTHFYIYLKYGEQGFTAIVIPNTIALVEKKEVAQDVEVARHDKNPLLTPRQEQSWESRCVFNPAVIKGDDGRVHMLYRAIGDDGVSRIGYASSKDGVHFDERHPHPVLIAEHPHSSVPENAQRFSLHLYPSGGSWGGHEDPRMVRIGDTIYLSFNTFDDWDSIRVGATTIHAQDFFEKNWTWKKPFFLSPKNEVNKNWVLFPEKIDGKFAVLHSISPEVQVDYVDTLEDLHHEKQTIRSKFGQRFDPNDWGAQLRGAGPPPLKTDRGWLVLYHAHERDELDRYKLGAMLLDLNDPTNVIARAQAPLLAPDMWYENDWKPGVVYACGAVIQDDELLIYYGGGDKYICLASTPLNDLLDAMTNNHDATITTRSIHVE